MPKTTRGKTGRIRTLRPELVIEMDGGRWTTSAKDPGSTCPKCGRALVWSDETVFCDGGFMGSNDCNFQYTFSQEEIDAEMRKQMAEEDKKALAQALERVKKEGPPVFGQVRPEEFILPSHLWEESEARWRDYLS